MRPFSFFINESIVDQLRYFIVDTYGETEYNKILKANPTALLDGLMSLSVTTKEKPQKTTPTSLKETPNGWISIYNKIDGY